MTRREFLLSSLWPLAQESQEKTPNNDLLLKLPQDYLEIKYRQTPLEMNYYSKLGAEKQNISFTPKELFTMFKKLKELFRYEQS